MCNSEYLNSLSEDAARATLRKCCASLHWVELMLEQRPFASDEALMDLAAKCGTHMSQEDWLQAFAAHPRIGDVATLREKFANTKAWASQEQSGVAAASDAVIHRLAKANETYIEKFGYLFIVCATGKSATEMLDLLETRMSNDAKTELIMAAQEQIKITRVRLGKLKS